MHHQVLTGLPLLDAEMRAVCSDGSVWEECCSSGICVSAVALQARVVGGRRLRQHRHRRGHAQNGNPAGVQQEGKGHAALMSHVSARVVVDCSSFCVVDAGSFLGSWKSKCLQLSILELCSSAKQRLALRSTFLAKCRNHVGAGMQGSALQMQNLHVVRQALCQERLCVHVLVVGDERLKAENSAGRCWHLGHPEGDVLGVVLWSVGALHAFACHGVRFDAVARCDTQEWLWPGSVVCGPKGRRPAFSDEERFEQLQRWFHEHEGQLPRQKSKGKDISQEEQKLAQWFNYCCKSGSAEMQLRLKTLRSEAVETRGGRVFSDTERFAQLQRWLHEHEGQLPRQESKGKDISQEEQKLAQWFKYCCKSGSAEMQLRLKTLRSEAVETRGGRVFSDTQRFEQLQSWLDQHIHVFPQRDAPDEYERELAYWVMNKLSRRLPLASYEKLQQLRVDARAQRDCALVERCLRYVDGNGGQRPGRDSSDPMEKDAYNDFVRLGRRLGNGGHKPKLSADALSVVQKRLFHIFGDDVSVRYQLDLAHTKLRPRPAEENEAELAAVSDCEDDHDFEVKDGTLPTLNPGEFSRLGTAVEEYVHLCSCRNLKVSAAIYVYVAHRMFMCSGQGLSQDHRRWVQAMLEYNFSDVQCCKDVFLSLDDVARRVRNCFKCSVSSLTLKALLEAAKGKHCGVSSCQPGSWCQQDGCYPPSEQARAIVVLLRDFRFVLEEDASLWGQSGHADAMSYWQERLRLVRACGVMCSQRVCCEPFVNLRAQLNGYAQPVRSVPFLPACGTEHACSFAQQKFAHRYDKYSALTAAQLSCSAGSSNKRSPLPHGICLLPLALDFLCARHQMEFLRLSEASLATLTQSELHDWCLRFHFTQLTVAGVESSVQLQRLQHELVRSRLRQSALGLAWNTSVQCEGEEEFQSFCDILSQECFLEEAVCSNLSGAQTRVNFHELFRYGLASEEYDTVTTSLGIRKRGNLWWSRALSRCETPLHWSDYTGYHGFVPREVWMLRAFARAAGGFEQLSSVLQRRLWLAEADHDLRYLCVTESSSSMQSSFKHVVHYHTELPMSLSMWLHLCLQLKDKDGQLRMINVSRLRDRIATECQKFGVHFKNGQWTKDVSALMDAVAVMHCDCGLHSEHAKLQFECSASQEEMSLVALESAADKIFARLWTAWTQRSSLAWLSLLHGETSHCIATALHSPESQLWEDNAEEEIPTRGGGAEDDGSVGSSQAVRLSVRRPMGQRLPAALPAQSGVSEPRRSRRIASQQQRSSSGTDSVKQGRQQEDSVDVCIEALRKVRVSSPQPLAAAKGMQSRLSGTMLLGNVSIVCVPTRFRGNSYSSLQPFEKEICDTCRDVLRELSDWRTVTYGTLYIQVDQALQQEAICYDWLQQVDLFEKCVRCLLPELYRSDFQVSTASGFVVDYQALRRAVDRLLADNDWQFMPMEQALRKLGADLDLFEGTLDSHTDFVHVVLVEQTLNHEEMRLQAWTADSALDLSRCHAVTWRSNADHAVLGQCCRVASKMGKWCKAHFDMMQANGLQHGSLQDCAQDSEAQGSCLEFSLSSLMKARPVARRRALRSRGQWPRLPGRGVPSGVSHGGLGGLAGPVASLPAYVGHVPGQLRQFSQDPIAMAPYVCRLCDFATASEAAFLSHQERAHVSTLEYRKRLFMEQASWHGVQPITPQVWRHVAEAHQEHLITGSSAWPEGDVCDMVDDGRKWWRSSDVDVSQGLSREELECPPADIDYDLLGTERRHAIRHMVACAVCARRDWSDTRQYVYFWEQAQDSGRQSFISDLGVDSVATPREILAEMFSPERYARRWAFDLEKGGRGGIPLAELKVSAVRDPGSGGKLWLLHRKSFQMISQDGVDVADPEQKVPICLDCKVPMSLQKPHIPKYSFPNDMWIGKLPGPMQSLSTGAWMLLPLSRALIRRYNCLPDSGKFVPFPLRIGAFIGNAVVFPQADGGRLLAQVPPSKEALQDNLVIAFLGTEEQLSKAYLEELRVPLGQFREAYTWLQKHNEQYASSRWNEDAEKELLVEDERLNIPKVLAACVQRQDPPSSGSLRTRQRGPADAVEKGVSRQAESDGREVEEQESSEASEEEMEWNAAVPDGDLQLDHEQQFRRVELSFRRWELRRAQLLKQAEARRKANRTFEQSAAAVDSLRTDASEFQKAVGKLDIKKIEAGVEQAEQKLNRTVKVPGERLLPSPSKWFQDKKRSVLCVPTAGQPVNMFEPGFWSAMDPKSFPYGDGVFGIERDHEISYIEWCRCLLMREEHQYTSHTEEQVSGTMHREEAASASVLQQGLDCLPRWRGARDLITIMYCLWRRRAYIHSARLLANRGLWSSALKDIGRLKPDEMYLTCDILGKGAGIKEVFSRQGVPRRVKKAMSTLLLCMSSVVGTNAHRTTLRHVNTSYKLLFGAPLVFTTPNFADTRSVILNLLYQGESIGSWKVLEDDCPDMPSAEEMMRRVARDPVSQAIVFDLMVKLFLEHVLGVDLQRKWPDGVASSGRFGLFGCTLAYFAPEETQGRGGLHVHMHVWILNPLKAATLQKLRSGQCSPELVEQLRNWRRHVLGKVATMQFDSVEEFGRQLGFTGDAQLASVPFSRVQQRKTYSAEEADFAEPDDLAVKPPPSWARNIVPQHEYDSQRWVVDPPQGPRRVRPQVKVASPELDPHEHGKSWLESRRTPLTGAHLCRIPRYLRKPPYCRGSSTDQDKRVQFACIPDLNTESRLWARAFMADARRCFIRSHIHRCVNTCWKHKRGGQAGETVRVCRFNMFHEFSVVVYARKPAPKLCKLDNSACPCAKHPHACPVPAQRGEVKKWLREGKSLVLPRDQKFVPAMVLESGMASDDVWQQMFDDVVNFVAANQRFPVVDSVVVNGGESGMGHWWQEQMQSLAAGTLENAEHALLLRVLRDGLIDYSPHVNTSKKFGGLGRVLAIRYNPCVSSSNPAGQVLFRCNWDVQCFDRVPVVEHSQVCLSKPCKSFVHCVSDGHDASKHAREQGSVGSCEDDAAMSSTEGDVVMDGEWTLDDEFLNSLSESIEMLFQDAADSAHYTTDYITKDNPVVSDVLPEQALGIERLRLEESEASKFSAAVEQTGVFARASAVDKGRRTLIRLQTSSNRATLKKLSEMSFQLMFGHECYQSHETWTLFTKVLVRLAYLASREQQCIFRGVVFNPDRDVEPEFAGEEEEEFERQDKGDDDPATLQAVVRYAASPKDTANGSDLSEDDAAVCRQRMAQLEANDGSRKPPMQGGGVRDANAGEREDCEEEQQEAVEKESCAEEEQAEAEEKRDGNCTEEEDEGLEAGDDDIEADDIAKAEDTPIRFDAGQERSQRLDWLHRGNMEPLASMGIYHYCMYVYSAAGDPLRIDPRDLCSFPFQDSHPGGHSRIQKLRIMEIFKVPRLFGFTMPAPVCRSTCEQNHMFQSVLFRPLRKMNPGSEHEPFAAIVDERGSFIAPWKSWFAEQRRLAARYEELERKAGKIFILADVDREAPYLDGPREAARQQPSSAEFMAHITLEVSTNLDISAAARSRPFRSTKPDPNEFVLPEHDVPEPRSGECAEKQESVLAGAGESDVLQAEETAKLTEPLFRIPESHLLQVAFAEEFGVAPALRQYRDNFLQLLGAMLGCSSKRTSSGMLQTHDFCVPLRQLSFEDGHEDQKKAFDFRDQSASHENSHSHLPVEAGRVKRSIPDDPKSAYWCDDGLPASPIEYASACVHELATRVGDPVVLGEEQLDFLALVVTKVEDFMMVDKQKDDGPSGRVEQSVILLLGQGGSGKTEVVGICRRLFEHFLGSGSCMAMASSNSAARGIGGDTIHSCCHMHGESGFSLRSLSKGITNGLKDRWRDTKALIIEEISLVSPRLLGAASYRTCCARQNSHGADPDLYATVGNMFGRVPIVILLGDFMQLPPFENRMRVSLLKFPHWQAFEEHYRGMDIFWQGITHVVQFHQTFRFVDRAVSPPRPCPWLPRLFSFMRNPQQHGGRLPEDVWRKLQARVVKGIIDDRVISPRIVNGYEMAIAWEAVARLMQARVLREARAEKAVVMYIQAIDYSKSRSLSPEDIRRALQVVNMTTTGNRLGILGLFIRQRVRLTSKECAKHKLVQDATGTVDGVEFDEREFSSQASDWRINAAHPVRQRGYVQLQYMPRGIYVKMDGYDGDHGFGPGIVVIRPRRSPWKYKTHFVDSDGTRRPAELSLTRINVPLAPEKVRTVQTAQGMTFDACIMFLARPGNMGEDDWWMHLYVMLSRVRTIDQLLLFDLPPRAMFERGPPSYVVEGLKKLESMSDKTLADLVAARLRCGWAQRSSGVVSGSVAPVANSASRDPRAVAPRTGARQRGNSDMPGASGTVGLANNAHTLSASRATSQSVGLPKSVDEVSRSAATNAVSAVVVSGTMTQDSQGSSCKQSSSLMPAASEAIGAVRNSQAPSGSSAMNESVVSGSSMSPAKRARFADATGSQCKSGSSGGQHLGSSGAAAAPALRGLSLQDVFSRVAPDATVITSLLQPMSPQISEFLYGLTPEQLRSSHWCRALRPPAGLHNLGNTCFMNSVLQVVARLEGLFSILQAHLDSCNVGANGNQCFCCSLASVCCNIRTAMHAVEPRDFARLVRLGSLGHEFRGSASGSGGQCDAEHFLMHLFNFLAQEESVRVHDLALPDVEYASAASRSLLAEHVCGLVVRTRIVCVDNPEHVSDSLKWLLNVELVVNEANGSSLSLQQLWESAFSRVQHDRDLACPCRDSHGCTARGARVYLLEREPPVLFISLRRAFRNQQGQEKKDSRPVSFPETFNHLRSSAYKFAAVIRHQGSGNQSGHYTSNVLLGEREDGSSAYAYCNDSAVSLHSWNDLMLDRVQREAFVLVYYRTRPCQHGFDYGLEHTPFQRERQSLIVCSQGRVVDAAGIGAGSSSSASVNEPAGSSQDAGASSAGVLAGSGNSTGRADTGGSSGSASSSSGRRNSHRILQRSLTMYPGDAQEDGLPVPRKAASFPPWVSANLPWLMPSRSSAAEASRFLTVISDTEDEAVAPMSVDLSAEQTASESQSTPQETSRHDLSQPFSAACVSSHHCLARIVKDRSVRQCSNRPKSGGDLCAQHATFRGKIKARYGKVTEEVPTSTVVELQDKLK